MEPWKQMILPGLALVVYVGVLRVVGCVVAVFRSHEPGCLPVEFEDEVAA